MGWRPPSGLLRCVAAAVTLFLVPQVLGICEDEIRQTMLSAGADNYITAAMCLAQRGAFDLALPYFKAAIEYLEASLGAPRRRDVLPELLFNLALTYQNMGDMDSALAQYNKAKTLFPEFYPAYVKAAWIHSMRGKYDAVLSLLRKAIAIQPEEPSTYFHLGNVLNNLKHWSIAVDIYKQGLSLAPNFIKGHLDLADTYTNLKNREAALVEYNIAYDLDPTNPDALIGLLQTKRDTCNWTQWQRLTKRVVAAVQEQVVSSQISSLSPYSSLFMNVSSQFQALVAQNWAQNAIGSIRSAMQYHHAFHQSPIHPGQKGKVRLGYISRKFEEYAGVHLSMGLFREHSTDEFELFAYAYGPDDGSLERQLVRQYSDKFCDVHLMSSVETARVIANDQIQILISFDGAHNFNSMEVLALRPAPIQVSLLGFAGTTGATVRQPASLGKEALVERIVDYLMTDEIVTPLSELSSYTERLAVLPVTYQPQDNNRSTFVTKGVSHITREDALLPEDAFVYACFNRADKVEPNVFDAWMRILLMVPHSVLWLYTDTNLLAEANLRKEALARGVDPIRLVFASKAPVNIYMEKLTLADLFLDTFFYGAHTTCTDALWMGLPVLTMSGGPTFASRVATSLLTALGMERELVVPSIDAYVECAINLGLSGHNSQRMNHLWKKLAENRDSIEYRLFSTKRYVKSFETCLHSMVAEFQLGCTGDPQPYSNLCTKPLMCPDTMEKKRNNIPHEEL